MNEENHHDHHHTLSMSARSSSQGVFCYTLFPSDSSSSPSIAFLLWRDRRSSSTESSQFWSHIVTPQTKLDASPLDAVCRGFAQKTCGLFAPQRPCTPLSTDETERISLSQANLKDKIMQRKGTSLLSNSSSNLIYLAPVRFVPSSTLNSSLSSKGECVWIAAKDLFSHLNNPNIPSASLVLKVFPLIKSNEFGPDLLEYPLYLPFSSLIRRPESLNEIAELIRPFGVEIDQIHQFQEEEKGNQEENSNQQQAPAPLSALSHGVLTTQYCCFKCRFPLFQNIDLMEHKAEAINSKDTFVNKKPGMLHTQTMAGGCNCFFLDPNHVDRRDALEAALGSFEELEGKLLCGKCKTRVGNFAWAGNQCSCGGWMVPGFSVTKSRVDAKPIINHANGPAAIRPVIMRPPVVRPNASTQPTEDSSNSTPSAP
jgi:hypothetical protein